VKVDAVFEERYWYPDDGSIIWLSGYTVLGDDGRSLAARRRILAQVIRAGFERLRDGTDDDEQLVPIADLVAAGESDIVEFKSAARYNQHTQSQDAKIALAIIKTVAAFANAKGGTLV